MGPRYAQRLLADIPPERFARLAVPGGVLIQSNHPAFILGHLSLYPAKVLQLLGQDASDVLPPAEFERLFSRDATCVDDPDGSIYPPQSAIVERFNTGYARAIEAIRGAPDEQLYAPNPVDTPMRQVCPTLGGLLAFYLTGHVMVHLGQLSAWRRMEGLPPA
ncbi:MAG: DinB family protein [Planctomycetota bacterium]|nr:MAG: DinB family protein [Planctomycetota bacterium]